MEIDFMIQYYTEDVHHTANMIALTLDKKQDIIAVQSIAVVEEQHLVLLFLQTPVGCLDKVKILLESMQIVSSKLFRSYDW